MKRRKQFRDLVTANSNLTYSRYWRLVALASVDFCFTIPLASWGIIANSMWSQVHPWVSWADTHWGYARVFQFPRILIDQEPVVLYSLETTRWAAVLCAFVFFGFFGFADEAKKNYRLLASTVTKRFGYTTFSETAAISDSYVLFAPPFISLPNNALTPYFLQYGQVWYWLEGRRFASSVHHPTDRIEEGFIRFLLGQALDLDHHRRVRPQSPTLLSHGTVDFVKFFEHQFARR